MKMTLESTTKMVTVNGVPARVWEGKTDSGIPVFAMITRIGVEKGQDLKQFEVELSECRVPELAPDIPARLIL